MIYEDSISRALCGVSVIRYSRTGGNHWSLANLYQDADR